MLASTANVATDTNSSYLSSAIPNAIVGNNINTFLFGSTGEATGSMVANSPSVVSAAMGSPTSWGRKTTDVLSLNLAGKGGVPLALGKPAAAAKALLGKVGNVSSLGMELTTKLGIDAAFTAAEVIACSIAAKKN